jgi:predicted site-specific integrase-resolvase
MSKTNNIDTTVWVTQQALAAELGVTVQCIHNWIGRGKIKDKRIPGSRLVLVDKRTAPEPGTKPSSKKSA